MCFQDSIGANEVPPKKTLVLIIASDGVPAYLELQRVWKSYMHRDPEHFEVYFIRGDPNLSKDYEISNDTITIKAAENYSPGIANKTVLSMEAIQPRLKEFDYVIRTNLSSFYYFPNLLKFLNKLPKQKCYCAISMYIPESACPKFGRIYFGSGAGIIVSPDLVEMMVKEKEDIFLYSSDLPDDVLIGLFFQKRNIPIINAERVDFFTREEYESKKDAIPAHAYHFRAKALYDLRRPEHEYQNELYILKQLLNKYYSIYLD